MGFVALRIDRLGELRSPIIDRPDTRSAT